jgi:phage shock protein PspC (stress-responsive transcriptional regulator)
MSLSDELQRLETLRQQGVLTPEEFVRAKAQVIASGGDGAAAPAMDIKRFRRSRTDRWVAGVCGGMASLTQSEPWLWRLGLALLILFGGTGVLLYLLLWIFVPVEGE